MRPARAGIEARFSPDHIVAAIPDLTARMDDEAEVVPILSKRGLCRIEHEGATLPDHPGIAWPA